MEPGVAAHTGSAAPNSTTNHLNRFAIYPPLDIEPMPTTRKPLGFMPIRLVPKRLDSSSRALLLHQELRCWGDRLLGDVVVHFDRQLVHARFETRERHTLLERNLL